MKDFKQLIAQRRSHRKFTQQPVEDADVKLLLRAALMSPTSKNQRAWKFVVVTDSRQMELLSHAKENGAQFLKDAPLAIVVLGNAEENDCWVEDGSLAAFAMQLQAEDLGLGSCWIQIRDRFDNDGKCAGFWVKKLAKGDKYEKEFIPINYNIPFPFEKIHKDETV
ncbi:MAG: nitroreductase family protein, partial [Bacteroidales bacterium]|nr:nitroreductase family protein [Bacteroidales bacterium]